MKSLDDATLLLHRWREGDESARNELVEMMQGDLHSAARQILYGERRRAGVDPTDLVNECFVRLVGLDQVDWQNRAHFLALSAITMRRILVGQARRQGAQKRDAVEVTMTSDIVGADQDSAEVMAVHEALERLERISAIRAKVVELKCFGGLTNGEIAEVLEVSETTVKRHWRSARAWMSLQLQG